MITWWRKSAFRKLILLTTVSAFLGVYAAEQYRKSLQIPQEPPPVEATVADKTKKAVEALRKADSDQKAKYAVLELVSKQFPVGINLKGEGVYVEAPSEVDKGWVRTLSERRIAYENYRQFQLAYSQLDPNKEIETGKMFVGKYAANREYEVILKGGAKRLAALSKAYEIHERLQKAKTDEEVQKTLSEFVKEVESIDQKNLTDEGKQKLTEIEKSADKIRLGSLIERLTADAKKGRIITTVRLR